MRHAINTLLRITIPRPSYGLTYVHQTLDTFQLRSIMSSSCARASSSTVGSTKPIVYVTRNIPPEGMRVLENEDLELRQWAFDDPVPRDELVKNVKDADGLYCLLTDKIDEELLSIANPELAVISTMSVGYDHIDIAACDRRNISVGFTPGVLTEATAELTLGLLLTTSRRLIESSAEVKSGGWGTWSPLWMCGSTLVSATVGIVGAYQSNWI